MKARSLLYNFKILRHKELIQHSIFWR